MTHKTLIWGMILVLVLLSAALLTYGGWLLGRQSAREAREPGPAQSPVTRVFTASATRPPLQVDAGATIPTQTRQVLTPPSGPVVVAALPSPSQTAALPTSAQPTTAPSTATPAPTDLPPSATAPPPTDLPTEATALATNSACPAPEGWVAHTVEYGETLFAYQLGAESAVTVDEIIAANCLPGRMIFEGQTLWLPPGAAENAPSSNPLPTAYVPAAGAAPVGLSRVPQCPCEVTIRPGLRLEEIAVLIDSLPLGFTGRDFLAVTGRGAAFGSRAIFTGMSPGSSLEGYILPGTYTVTNEMDAVAFREMVLDAFAAAAEGLLHDGAGRGLTPYEVVILASVIVKESGSYNQMLMISSVFHNRLQRGNGLGATVTSQYALGTPGNWWPNVNGRISTLDSPYNTNRNPGLPPSPIASPNMDALRAAVYPADTNYLFFTGNCRGPGNAYAETYEQHLANVRCQ